MSYGNLPVILMVILVAICGVGGSFVATYYLNKAMRRRSIEPVRAAVEIKNRGD